jgi:hypothetical protein
MPLFRVSALNSILCRVSVFSIITSFRRDCKPALLSVPVSNGLHWQLTPPKTRADVEFYPIGQATDDIAFAIGSGNSREPESIYDYGTRCNMDCLGEDALGRN